MPSRLAHHLPTLALVALVAYAAIAIGAHLLLMLRSEGLITASQGDYANYAEIARIYANGGQMYVDYWTTKPPGVFLYLTPFVALWGNTFFAVNLGTISIIVSFIVAVTVLAYSITRSSLATLGAAALALMYCTYQIGPETTLTMTMFSTWAFVIAVLGRGRFGWMVVSGFLFAAASVVKQPVLAEAPALLGLAIWFAPRTRTSLIRVVAGFALGGLLGFALLAIWAASQGILEAMLDKGYGLNIQYVLAEDGQWHFSSESAGYFQEYFLGNTVPYLRPLLILAGISAVVALRQGRRRGLFALLVMWFLLAFFGAAAARALHPRYFFEVLPPLLILVAFGLSSIAARHWLLRTALVACLAVTVLTVQARATYASDELRNTTADENGIVATIQQRVPEGECLWTWGQVSVLNYLSARTSCASPALNGFVMDDNTFPIHRTRLEYMHEIINRRPSLLVTDNRWGFFPQLENFAERYVGDMIQQNEIYNVFAVDRSMWHETDANFGGEIRLIGYDLLPVDGPVCAGDTLTLAMTWEQISPPAHQYQMFVQLLTPDETARVAGYDGPPEDDDNATNTWVDTGEIRLGEHFDMPIDADAAPGPYKLVVGLYDVETAERVPVLDASGAPIGSYAVLQNVEVSACD